MELIFASVVMKVVTAVIAIAGIIWFIATLANNNGKWQLIVSAILTGLSIWAFVWGLGHQIVKPNEVMLVISRQTGEPIAPIRTTGVTEVSLFVTKIYRYPAQRVYQWCPVFTPSSKGGASLSTTVCFTADASQIDWIAQFKAFNGKISVIETGWQNAIQAQVAAAVSGFVPRDLTDNRTGVEEAIFNATKQWFENNGIPITMVGLRNWEFANEAVNEAYDQALLSQTLIDVANSEQQAALIKAETQKLIAETQRQACTTAGMVSEDACLQYLWLTSGIDPTSVFLVVGGDAPNIAVPAATTVP